ncbi:MAG: hypothetical protein D6736_16350 [Nitrospinota bacterium]|nr:MAG: hypothetical protein D6736_16350 [Nitrospinota bacterium]
MRIGIFGDIQGYFGPTNQLLIDYFADLVATLDCDFFLQTGDMCHYRSFARPVYWIYGNNDWPPVIREIAEGRRDITNLHHLPTGQIVTLQRGEECVRVSGLNGAFEEIYYHARPGEYPAYELAGYFQASDIEACLALAGESIDIFLTHGCPAGLGLGREPDHAVPVIRELLDRLQPRYLFCGHAHFFRCLRYGPSTVCSLAPLEEEFYLLDTQTDQLERVKSRPLPELHPYRQAGKGR